MVLALERPYEKPNIQKWKLVCMLGFVRNDQGTSQFPMKFYLPKQDSFTLKPMGTTILELEEAGFLTSEKDMVCVL